MLTPSFLMFSPFFLKNNFFPVYRDFFGKTKNSLAVIIFITFKNYFDFI